MAVDARGVGGVALPMELVGLGMQGQRIRIVNGLVGAAAFEERAEAL